MCKRLVNIIITVILLHVVKSAPKTKEKISWIEKRNKLRQELFENESLEATGGT